MTVKSLVSQVNQRTRLILLALVVFGVVFLFRYLIWWIPGEILYNPIVLILFIGAIAYSLVQLLGNWLLQLAASFHTRPQSAYNPQHLSVDVFLTANGEDKALIIRALSAAVAMRVPHQTWLLDDGGDPQLAHLAEQYGAGYLTRQGHDDAKAGNLNSALRHTEGDIIAIFDIDHAPLPDFLEQSLGHFEDPQVGFVQVMLTFGAGDDGIVAEAASDSSLDFYNAIAVGSDALGSVTLIGSNALIRRSALESIGGYRPGLAEDLATSIALHAAGWRSVYVHEPLAPGFSPPDLVAWFTQQMKWARGVFELLLTTYPRKFKSLTWQQRVVYSVRTTYYWIGLVAAAHLLATSAALFIGSETAIRTLDSYLWRLLPLAAATVGIRYFALKQCGHRTINSGNPLKSLSLIYLTWPVYTAAWLMAVLRIPLRFRPTPKTLGGGIPLVWLMPQFIMFTLLSIGLAYSLPVIRLTSAWLVLVCVVAQAIGQLFPFLFLGKMNSSPGELSSDKTVRATSSNYTSDVTTRNTQQSLID